MARLRRFEWLLAPLGFVLLVTILYRTIWFAPEGKPRQWFGWDCIESFWPDLSYYAGATRAGEAPLWNPYDRGGYAFYGDPHPGLYYPVTWAFVAVGAAAGQMPGWTIQVKALLHHVIGALLLYAYLRSRKLPVAAAAVGGAAFVVSVPMIIHKASALAWPMVWAPLIWITTDRAIDGAGKAGWWRRSVALAGAIGLAGSSGPPPGFFYILLVSLGYGALRLGQTLLDARAAGRIRTALREQARTLAVAGALTGALLAVVVLPGLDIATESATRGSARNLGYALNTGLPAGASLVGLVAPTGGKVDAYLGILVLALGIVAVGTRPKADRWVPVGFLVVAALALDLAFGTGSHLLPWLVKHVPGFGLFREPNRYKIVTAMAMAVVAGHGVAALVHTDVAVRRRALALLAGAMTALLVSVIVIRSQARPAHPEFPGYGVGLFVLGTGGALLGAAAFAPVAWRIVPVAGVVLLMFVDVTRYGYGFLGAREAPVDDQEDRRYVADLGVDVEREYRVYDEFVMEQRPGSRLRIRDFRGYPSGDPFDDARYSEVRARLKQNPELLGAFNVRYVLWGPHHRNGLSKNHIQRPPDQAAPARFRRIDAKRYELIDPAPLVAWYGAAEIVPGKAQALAAVVAMEAAPGGRDRAIVERADQGAAAAALAPLTSGARGPARPGRAIRYQANRIVVEVDAPAAGIVVLNEKMAPGWRARVDGAAAPAFRANYLSRAVTVGPGLHRIEWTYHPPRFASLFGLWLVGVAVLVTAAVSAVRARRRERAAAAAGAAGAGAASASG